ncbi:MAG TPA: DUF1634 domain-containing protein, partial [Myxococcaceae bacterium]|nr:DUF1634 domain-containing protein [Myxococcaceae bacterium]
MTPDAALLRKHVAAVAAARPAEAMLPMELLISQLLRYGVIISIGFVLAGTLISFLNHPDYLSSSASLERLIRPASVPHGLSEVLAGVQAARGQALVMMGLLLLISLPVTRVALSLLVFSYQRDRTFVTITG